MPQPATRLGDELAEQAAGGFVEAAFQGAVVAGEEDIGGKAGSDVPVAGELLAVVEGEGVREWANGASRFWMASPTCATVRLVSAGVSVNLERRSTSLATARIEVVPVVWTGRLPVRMRGSC